MKTKIKISELDNLITENFEKDTQLHWVSFKDISDLDFELGKKESKERYVFGITDQHIEQDVIITEYIKAYIRQNDDVPLLTIIDVILFLIDNLWSSYGSMLLNEYRDKDLEEKDLNRIIDKIRLIFETQKETLPKGSLRELIIDMLSLFKTDVADKTISDENKIFVKNVIDDHSLSLNYKKQWEK